MASGGEGVEGELRGKLKIIARDVRAGNNLIGLTTMKVGELLIYGVRSR
jgi:hypothetical protein